MVTSLLYPSLPPPSSIRMIIANWGRCVNTLHLYQSWILNDVSMTLVYSNYKSVTKMMPVYTRASSFHLINKQI